MAAETVSRETCKRMSVICDRCARRHGVGSNFWSVFPVAISAKAWVASITFAQLTGALGQLGSWAVQRLCSRFGECPVLRTPRPVEFPGSKCVQASFVAEPVEFPGSDCTRVARMTGRGEIPASKYASAALMTEPANFLVAKTPGYLTTGSGGQSY